MLKISSTPINAHMDRSKPGLSHNYFRSRSGCERSDRPQNALVKGLSFSIATEYTRALSLPQIKNLKDWVRRMWGLYLIICLPTWIFISFFFFWRTHSWYIFMYFCYVLYIFIVRHYLSQPHKTASQVILFFLSTFTSLDSHIQTPDL